MLAAEATGVATYARTLVAALVQTGAPPLILDDLAKGAFGQSEGLGARARRWLDARGAGPVRLEESADGFVARDVFRRAHARFNASGALLDLDAPGPPGVMHWTYPVAARVRGWENLYTVHDVIPLTDPALAETDGVGLRVRLEALLAAGGRIATVSAWSRREIAETLGIAEASILDLGSAVEPANAVGQGLPPGLEPGFYLFCGSAEPRKNLDRILAAWQASGSARPLVLAGHAPRGNRGLGVVELGFVPRSTLLALIAAARALVFPTLAEGFGLPVVEAMAQGTPVITTDRGALAEVAGNAALLVDPFDVAAIGRAVARLDRDDGLHAVLAARGLGRARAFSLEAFGARLRAGYREITGDSIGIA
jgi:glycosyltransferase involved in cell wall biosynthesis